MPPLHHLPLLQQYIYAAIYIAPLGKIRMNEKSLDCLVRIARLPATTAYLLHTFNSNRAVWRACSIAMVAYYHFITRG